MRLPGFSSLKTRPPELRRYSCVVLRVLPAAPAAFCCFGQLPRNAVCLRILSPIFPAAYGRTSHDRQLRKKILTFCSFRSGRLFYLFFAFLILNYRFNTQRIFICLLSPLPLCCCHYRYNRTIGLLRVLLSCLFFQNSVKLSTSFFILFFIDIINHV